MAFINNKYEKIFDLTPIHQKYWKDFCDVCYSRFGFEQGEVRTYEQRYETFCRCKNYVTSEEGYEQQLMMTKEEDFVRLHSYAEWFFGIDDACDIIPALYNLIRMLWNIRRNLKSDMQLIKYFCPRKPKVKYSDYKLDIKKIPDNIRNNKTIREVLRSQINAALLENIMGAEEFYYQTEDVPMKSELPDGTPFEYNNADGSIVSLVNYILNDHVHCYNVELNDFVESLPDGCECTSGSELQAFIYRLFMSYGQSLREIKEMVEEYPSPRNLEVLKTEYEHLVAEFEETRLGEHWMECIQEKGGLQHIAKFFMHKRKRIAEDEEQAFFYTLDKICVISDILNGKADKYWLELKYPEGWIKKEEQITVEQLSERRQQILKRLLRLVGRGDWVEPATEDVIRNFILNALGVGSIVLTTDEKVLVTAMWKLLETGSGDRVTVVFQNLIGYFVSRDWLRKGSPALNIKFFGTKEGYTNIDKGNPLGTGMSEGFKKVLPLLDKCAEAIKS